MKYRVRLKCSASRALVTANASQSSQMLEALETSEWSSAGCDAHQDVAAEAAATRFAAAGTSCAADPSAKPAAGPRGRGGMKSAHAVCALSTLILE